MYNRFDIQGKMIKTLYNQCSINQNRGNYYLNYPVVPEKRS